MKIYRKEIEFEFKLDDGKVAYVHASGIPIPAERDVEQEIAELTIDAWIYADENDFDGRHISSSEDPKIWDKVEQKTIDALS